MNGSIGLLIAGDQTFRFRINLQTPSRQRYSSTMSQYARLQPPFASPAAGPSLNGIPSSI
jgi:hypothetical protein